MDVEEENSVGTALQGLPSLRQGNFSAEAMITKNRKLKPKRYVHTSADAAIETPQCTAAFVKCLNDCALRFFFFLYPHEHNQFLARNMFPPKIVSSATTHTRDFEQ
eukprot:m.183413 g.183413  ORF g.183413 m.183413 type:complete len:106 (-) comp18478_c0_seq4:95-412(-)